MSDVTDAQIMSNEELAFILKLRSNPEALPEVEEILDQNIPNQRKASQ